MEPIGLPLERTGQRPDRGQIVPLLLIAAAVLAGAAMQAQELPKGNGADEVARRCLTCHEPDLIAQQRLSTAAWGREVDKMIRWGAAVEPSERDAIVAYLAGRFSPAL